MTSIQGNKLNEMFQDRKAGGFNNNDFKALLNGGQKMEK